MLRKTLLLPIFILAISMIAFAQNNSTLKGRVVDQNQAVITGATVTISGDQLQTKKTTVTDGNGNFLFLGLVPGNYQVEVTKDGFNPIKQENIQLRATQTLELDLSLEVGEVSGTVQVRAAEDSPIIDTSNPENNFNVSGEFITQMPLNDRQTWEALWTLVPGVGGFPVDSNYDPSVNGAATISNSYNLNGFDVGNAFTNQGWRTQFSTEAIQDVVIKTAGADASTPLSQGGAINVVTKSGGNQFHGSAGIFFQPKKFNWTNVPGGTSPDVTLYQPDLSFGGPVVFPRFGKGGPLFWKGTDKLWFFVTYRNVVSDKGIARSAASLANFSNLGITAPTFDLEERSNRFTGKLSYQVNNNHSFVFNYLNDSGVVKNQSNSPEITLKEATFDLHSGGATYQIVWTGNLTSNLLWTAQYGYRNYNDNIDAKGGSNISRRLCEDVFLDPGFGAYCSGATLLYDGNRAGGAYNSISTRPHQQFSTDLTYVGNAFGSHTVQAGFNMKPDTKSTSASSYLTLPSTVDEVLINGVRVPFSTFAFDQSEIVGFDRVTRQKGFFLQDKWTITPRLTLNIGGRTDNQQSIDYYGDAIYDKWTFNPRLGFAYSLNREGRDVIRGSWGRYSDILVLSQQPLSPFSGQVGYTYSYDTNLDGTYDTLFTVPSTPPATSAPEPTGSFQTRYDPNLTVSYTDKMHIGYTRQLPFRVVFDAAFVQSKFQDNRLRTTNGNFIYTNGAFTGLMFPTSYNGMTYYTNSKNSSETYRSLQLSVNRNIGGKYSFFANYNYQVSKLTGSWEEFDPESIWFGDSYFEDNKRVKPHLFSFSGDVKLPWGIKTSAIFTVESGQYGGYRQTVLAANDPEVTRYPSTVPIGGRNVRNPLANRTRLLFPRSEGRLQAPTRTNLNLRFGKNFKLPREGQVVETALDIFNVFNDDTPLFFNNSTRDDLSSFGTYSTFRAAPRGVQLSVRYRF